MDESSESAPDWVIDLNAPSPDAMSAAERARLAELAVVSEEIGAHFRALKPLTRRAQELVDEALAAGLSVETIANHTTLRPGGLQAYKDGEGPLFPQF